MVAAHSRRLPWERALLPDIGRYRCKKRARGLKKKELERAVGRAHFLATREELVFARFGSCWDPGAHTGPIGFWRWPNYKPS